MLYKKLLLYVLLIFIKCMICLFALKVGDACRTRTLRKPGICKYQADCKKIVQSDLQRCGLQNNKRVICCETTNSNPPPSIYKPVTTTTAVPVRSRKSDQKCIEYSKPVVHENFYSPLSSSVVAKEYIPNCEYNEIPLIVGGKEAGLGEFPHMAIIRYENGNWGCGGTLISDKYVLTAAHCSGLRDVGNAKIVRLGELILSKEEVNSVPEDIPIEEFIKHPEYIKPRNYNDIALIKLSRSVKFDKYKRPACLWTKRNIDESTATATGWGTIVFGGDSNSDHLLKVNLDIVNNEICNETFDPDARRIPDGIRNTMMCAVNTTHAGDTCQGDSGGPLQIADPNNRCIYYIIGITSFGRGCGTTSPSIYTRVSEYVDWIESIVWP